MAHAKEPPGRPGPTTSPRPRPAEAAGRALAVLTLINLLNYLDRFVVSALVESLRHSELKLSDTQSGLLMTGFIVVYTATSPFFGALGDRRARPRLIAVGVFVWSLATALSGFARGFGSLLVTRSVVGDIGVSVIYGLVLTLQIIMFARWQKRPVLEPDAVGEVSEAPSDTGGPLSRLLRRREKRVSAYGRPVTTAGE